MRSVCVFCGSNPGARPAYAEAARRLGAALAGRGIHLVYGGGRVGLMGILADAALAAGGVVVGVIPRAMATKEIAHRELSELRVVASMHERKALMAELADGFIALPGGFGTLEELLEMVTWTQLGLHAKPAAVLNVEGYFDKLLALVEQAIEERFVHPGYRSLIACEVDLDRLLATMEGWSPPSGFRKWLTVEES